VLKSRAWDEKAALISVAFLLILPAWLRAGTNVEWSWPLTWSALMVAGFLGFLSWNRRRTDVSGSSSDSASFLRFRDPVFALGLLFMLLLVVQWWNAGRLLYYDSATTSWNYSEPRHAGWPSAITRAEARQMLDWFLPAWIIVLAVRSPGFSTRAIRKLWRVVAYHAGLLALFGLVNYAFGSTHMFGFVPMRLHFFATFGYPNHAGSYFMLGLCLSTALLSWELGGAREGVNRGRVVALIAVMALCYVGAVFSLSRLAILLATALLPVMVFFLIASVWPALPTVQRVHVVATSLAIMGLAVVLTLRAWAGRRYEREFKPERDSINFMDRETSFRLVQITVGHSHVDGSSVGRGGRVGLSLSDRALSAASGSGGVSLRARRMCTTIPLNSSPNSDWWVEPAWPVWSACWRSRRGGNGHPHVPLWWMPLLGCALVGGQSLIDLPFRSPAVLALWLLMLAGSARVIPPPPPGDTRTPSCRLNC
jgi:hypothetical protein